MLAESLREVESTYEDKCGFRLSEKSTQRHFNFVVPVEKPHHCHCFSKSCTSQAPVNEEVVKQDGLRFVIATRAAPSVASLKRASEKLCPSAKINVVVKAVPCL